MNTNKILKVLFVALLTTQCGPVSDKTSSGTTDSKKPLQPSPSPSASPNPSPSPSPTPIDGVPVPNHALGFGYYYSDSKYGNYQTEVDCYTNMYYAGGHNAYYAGSDVPPDEWIPLMRASVQKAVATNKKITLAIGLTDTATDINYRLDRVLKLMKDYWQNVYLIELADEPSWTKLQTENKLREVRNLLATHGLPERPLGVVYTQNQTLTENAIFASGLDWVGIEGYVNPPGDDNSQVNVNVLNKFLKDAKARIPADKKIMIIMQAYSRNYGWTNIDTLKDLQMPAYLHGYDDPRVLGINMFAYGRPSGSREYPPLVKVHKKIGRAILRNPAACQ